MGCGRGWGRGLGTGQGQWWVVVGVPRWYMDGRDDDDVGAVSTDRMHRDRVHQRSWHWYGCCPKQLSGWGVHVVRALVRVWAQ
jgi:hypothetical protein